MTPPLKQALKEENIKEVMNIGYVKSKDYGTSEKYEEEL
jgi:hypothetical protein